MRVAYPLLLIVAVQFAMASPAVCDDSAIIVDFCALSVPAWAMQANLSGSVIVRFYLDDDGVPEQLEVLLNLLNKRDLVPSEEIERCVNNWRFPNLAPGTLITAVWNWKHGQGWTKLSVVPQYGPAMTVKATGDHSPYGTTVQEKRHKDQQ